jgi:hypothetical protein
MLDKDSESTLGSSVGNLQVIMQQDQEEAKCETDSASKEQALQYKLVKLKQLYDTIWMEKWSIQAERDKLQKDRNKLQKDIVNLQLCADKEVANSVTAALRDELAKEQSKNICQICFNAPRDCVVLPCTHFHFCHDCLQNHQRQSKECPSCRGKINGLLQCSLNMN